MFHSMNVTGERLRSAMKTAGLDQEALADQVGCTQGAISQILLGNTQRSRFLPSIAEKLGVPLPWLMGEIDEQHPGAGTSFAMPALVKQLGLAMIPEVDISYSMGGGAVVEEYAPTTMVPFRQDWLTRITRGGPADVFLTHPVGDSMIPTILDGDDVLVNRAEKAVRHQDLIWAVGYGDLGMIKRVRRLSSGMFQLNSDNPNVSPIEAAEDELFFVGRVIWIGRRM
jgi:phage repressor protein C with HTH and peptisase S24 domain